ncbi:unnamed protein product [Notodromas monacha]|uniref:Innexin n=1 Tax=Notodromas monacha TaxID=399045 RepID=A0A7R9BYL1_9CRUS|nr:unnamed protein product [Notodromas monacha]CAG0922525.1 unnamed protein product [Notodromas monacha]
MLSAFADVKPYVKVSSTNKVRFDTTVNKLHYRATVVFLMLCCILVVINDYIGKTIECISKGGAANNAVTTYCWISSTYTLPSELDKETGVGVAQPGVGPGLPPPNSSFSAG